MACEHKQLQLQPGSDDYVVCNACGVRWTRLGTQPPQDDKSSIAAASEDSRSYLDSRIHRAR